MGIVRASLRLLILLSTILLVPICLALVLTAAAFGRRVRYAVVMAATPLWCRIWLAGFGVRLRFEGRPSAGAKIFVGNHVSYMDIFVAGAATGGIFVSRHDVKDWPLIGWFARMAGTVFIDRTSLRSAIESGRGIAARVAEGARITLFPEGGVLRGDGVKPFKPFLLAGIAEARLPVQPFAINYTHVDGEPLNEANRNDIEWHDTPIHVHAWKIMKMSSVRAVVRFADVLTFEGTADSNGARSFSEELRASVASSLH